MRARPLAPHRTVPALALLALAAAVPAAHAAEGAILFPSAKADGTAGDGAVSAAVTSATGRWVVFSSAADGLVPGDANGKRDVFIRDTKTGALRIVSRGAAPANGDSDASGDANGIGLGVSVDGRFVVFDSEATNLVAGVADANAADDIFRWDAKTGKILLVSRKPGGGAANGGSRLPRMSGDGRLIAFQSSATDLTSIAPGGNTPQVYVRDLLTGKTRFVSLAADGTAPDAFAERADISADGRFIAFASDATDIVPGDDGLQRDIFRRDLRTNTTTKMSLTAADAASDGFSDVPTISGNGRFVAFESDGVLVPTDANGFRDAYVRDALKGTTLRASLRDDDGEIAGGVGRPRVAADGRRVAFRSDANAITPDDDNNVTDVFVRDLEAKTTLRASATLAGDDAGGAAGLPAISGNGRAVAFIVDGTGALLVADTNDDADAYVRTLAAGADVKAPTIRFRGKYAVIGTDRSGIALVTVGTKRVRPDADRKVRVRIGQRIRVWDGAGNQLGKRR